MRMEHLFISVAIFCLFMTGGVLVFQDINVNYGKNLSTDEFGNSYDKIAELYNLTDDISGSVIDVGLDDTSPEDSMFKGTFAAFGMFKKIFEIIGAIVQDLAGALGLPPIFIMFTVLCLIIMVVFAIIYIVRGIA